MLALTERIKNLRQKALAWEESQTAYIGQRLYWAIDGLRATNASMPLMKRKSHMLASIIENSNPIIHDEELIVGYNYYGSDWGMYQEVALHPRSRDERNKLEDYLQKGNLKGEQIQFILNTLDNITSLLPEARYSLDNPKEAAEAEDDGVVWAYATPSNHTIIGYDKVLKLGFKGIRDSILQQLESLDWSDPDSVHKRLLLESAYEIADAACKIGQNYRNEALKLAKECSNPKRKHELESIADILERVPEHPASSFHEAIQSLWFAHIINCWEDGINANSLGRLDQMLYPYYRRDIDEGRITDQQAFELICCLWIKLYRDYDVQQVTLSGLDVDGKDATNELTYLMLDATEALDFVRCLSVRLHKGSPAKLIRRSLEIVEKGKGIPFFFNDDTLIPALADNGIAIEDARNYAAIGCVEITIPGKANPHAVSNRINLLKCLELALNNGTSMVTGKSIGVKTGNPSEFKNIEDIWAAYEKQAEHFIKLAAFESNRLELHYSYAVPVTYKSMLTEGCLESGKDFNAGGARYNYHESMAMGIPNVADSFASIQKLVFEDKKYDLEEMLNFIKNDFPDESVRQEIIKRTPKFGNDEDAVDDYAQRAMKHFCIILKQQKGILKGGFFAQPFTFYWLVDAGEKTAATPDGRHNGENLAYSVSPMQGRDFKGLTALINSLSKLPHNMAAGSTSAIIEVDPMLFNEKNIEWMTVFLQTAIQKGVGQMQFNVVNAETLKKAQREPDKYRNLAVRVSGFSQRFCLLDKKLQDHIIARTKHKIG